MSCTQEGGVSCPDLQVVESSEQEICAHTSELRTHTARGELCEIESTTERNSQAASVLRDVLCPPPARTPRRTGRHEAGAAASFYLKGFDYIEIGYDYLFCIATRPPSASLA